MDDPQVLIVGAGPTGLVMALFLAKQGIKPRIIDKNTGPGLASRAMVVQARTLEFYRQLGFADEVVNKGIKMGTVHLWEHGQNAAEIKIADFGAGLSPFSFPLSFPQDDHERLLNEHLNASGIKVEWETELVEFVETETQIQANIRNKEVEETCHVAYLCGCDGAHSTVRKDLKLNFPGGTYDQNFFVADVEATGESAGDNSFSACLGTNELCLVFPIRSTGMHRLIGLVPNDLNKRADLTFADLQPFVEKLTGIQIDKLNWFSKYRVHHRVTDHFRVGRAFVSGDAGHIHSPAGGQGMNTGIGDAINLAWKLAAVLQGRANPEILETYETERIAFARILVASTDKAFQLMIGGSVGSKVFRESLLPHLAPFVFGFSGVRTAAFKLISQTRISYHESALSEGAAGEIHGGDRLPWVVFDEGSDNFEPLKSVDWQAHVYGEAKDELRAAAQSSGIELHQFAWNEAAHHAGLKRDALYLVRPDGYVALADAHQDVETFQAYLTKFEILPRINPE